MSILHNGQQYGAVQVINYSAALDYNRGVEITNIQDGTYIAPDNGYILITLKSEQSNPTKVSVLRNKEPITDVGEEIASRILQQYQYSETLTVNVLARDYYKLFIEGAGNPKILKCMFYPFASTVPMKLIDTITPEQVEGVLPVDKGGTGDTNLNNISNIVDYDTLKASLGITDKPSITSLYDKLPNNTILSVYIPNGMIDEASGDSIYTIHKTDNNKGFYTSYDYVDDDVIEFFNMRQGNSFRGWRIRRLKYGIIPFEMGGVLKTYTNSYGTWTETKLSDGKILLEGWGEGVLTIDENFNMGDGGVWECNSSYNIRFPKNLDTSLSFWHIKRGNKAYVFEKIPFSYGLNIWDNSSDSGVADRCSDFTGERIEFHVIGITI